MLTRNRLSSVVDNYDATPRYPLLPDNFYPFKLECYATAWLCYSVLFAIVIITFGLFFPSRSLARSPKKCVFFLSLVLLDELNKLLIFTKSPLLFPWAIVVGLCINIMAIFSLLRLNTMSAH